MLQIVLLSAVMASLFSAAQSDILFKDHLTPEEAQSYLKALPFNEPNLAPKTKTLPLVRFDDPRFRTAEVGPTLGHYWKNGKEIENTDDYVEDVFEASQFHGQDGLGQYAYGYETPESSKVEDRKGSGVVTGSYVYKSPGHDLVKVKYWADSDGFHQEDNLPKVELKPVEETEALRAARLRFEKAWQEAAEANSKGPVLPPGYYNSNQQAQASENVPVSVYAPGPKAPRPTSQLYQQQQNLVAQQQASQQQQQYQSPQQQASQQQQQYQSPQQQASQQQQQYQSPQQSYNQAQQYNQQDQYNQQQRYTQQYGQEEPLSDLAEPDPTGPPYGFFYSFNYPVSIIVSKKDQANQENDSGSVSS